MPVDSPPTIDAMPESPLRNQPGPEFNAAAAIFVAALDPFGDQVDSVGVWMEETANQTEVWAGQAEGFASDAGSYADISAAVANFKGAWADQTGAASIPYSVFESGDFYALLSNLADVTTSQPSLNPSDWANITASMSGYTNPLTTKGDIIVADTGGAQTRFAASTAAGTARLLRYDVDTQAFSWADEADYLGGGSGGDGTLTWVDKGNVAVSGSETVTIDFSAGSFQTMSMESSNTTGTLTIQLTNLPSTTDKTASMYLLIRRGGRKAVTITAAGFTINYTQGASPNYNGTSGYFDVIEVFKKFSSTQLDLSPVKTGIY